MNTKTLSPPTKAHNAKKTHAEIKADIEKERTRRQNFPFPVASPTNLLPNADPGEAILRENLLIENDYSRRNQHRAPFFPVASDAVLKAFQYFWANSFIPDTVLPENELREKFETKQADLTEINEFLSIFFDVDFADERTKSWVYEATMLREIAAHARGFTQTAANNALTQYFMQFEENHRTTLLAAINFFQSNNADNAPFNKEELLHAAEKLNEVEELQLSAREFDYGRSTADRYSNENALWQDLWSDPTVKGILAEYDKEKKLFVASLLADLQEIDVAVNKLQAKYFRSNKKINRAMLFSNGKELPEEIWQEFDPKYLPAAEIYAEIGEVSTISMYIYAARLLQKMNRRDKDGQPINNAEMMERVWRAKAIFSPFLEVSGRSGFSSALLELVSRLCEKFRGNEEFGSKVEEARKVLDSFGSPDQVHDLGYSYMKEIFAGDVIHEPSFKFNDDVGVIIGEGIIAVDEDPNNDLRYVIRRKTPTSLAQKITRKNAALEEKIRQTTDAEKIQSLSSEIITSSNIKEKIQDMIALTVIPKDPELENEQADENPKNAEKRLAEILAKAANSISLSNNLEIVAVEAFGKDESWHSLIESALKEVGFDTNSLLPDKQRDWINAKIIFRDLGRGITVELQFATEAQRESNNLDHDDSKSGVKSTEKDMTVKRHWRQIRKDLRRGILPQESLTRGVKFRDRFAKIFIDTFDVALTSLRRIQKIAYRE